MSILKKVFFLFMLAGFIGSSYAATEGLGVERQVAESQAAEEKIEGIEDEEESTGPGCA